MLIHLFFAELHSLESEIVKPRGKPRVGSGSLEGGDLVLLPIYTPEHVSHLGLVPDG